MSDQDPRQSTWQLLEDAYLASDNPRRQSGFGGDEDRWNRARGIIADIIHRDGTFLDIGCANGYLMESVVHWCQERGRSIEPYGLDVSEKLVDLARERLPKWWDRFFVGDALTWSPAMQFDFVRTELVYVLDDDRPRYVEHLMTNVVAPGGRLIVCSYGSSRRPEPRVEPLAEMLRGWGYDITDHREVVHTNGVVITRVACVDRVFNRDETQPRIA